jgi:hypothetical protein
MRHVEEVVFSADQREVAHRRIVKLDRRILRPIRFRVESLGSRTGEIEDRIGYLMTDFSMASGVPVAFTGEEPAELTFVVAPQDRLAAKVAELGGRWNESNNCGFYRQLGIDGRSSRLIVAIELRSFEGCALPLLARFFGLYGSSCRMPSVTCVGSPASETPTELTRTDRRILGALYYQQVVPNHERKAALDVMRGLLASGQR